MINHRIARLVFAFAVGIFLSIYAYRIVTDPEPARERAREEAAVWASRGIISEIVSADGKLQIVDPLAPDRVVGKTYVYPAGNGWEVSGHYRRNSGDRWHPYLMSIDENLRLQALSVRDSSADLAERSRSDPRLTVAP
jgi:hypothetical protein